MSDPILYLILGLFAGMLLGGTLGVLFFWESIRSYERSITIIEREIDLIERWERERKDDLNRNNPDGGGRDEENL